MAAGTMLAFSFEAYLNFMGARFDSRNAAGVFSALKACRQWASAEAES
jgi:hypothetical protein